MSASDGSTIDVRKVNKIIADKRLAVAALGELITAREYVLKHGGDILTSASWAKAIRAYEGAVSETGPSATLRIANLRAIANDESVNNFARSICSEVADHLCGR